MTHRVLIIDNHDSFTFNLYQMLAGMAASVEVVRNDAIEYAAIAAADFSSIVISPGPGNPHNPDDLGVTADVLMRDPRPILGVCLGHQAMAALAGGDVGHAPEPVHGRVSAIRHAGAGLFADLPNPLSAVRYHSWIVRNAGPDFIADAWTADGLIMGMRHRVRPHWGVQFHPESICTEAGHALLANFLSLASSRSPHFTTAPPALLQNQPTMAAPSSYAGASSVRDSGAQALRVVAERISHGLSAERTFSKLFGYRPGSFWLDSSRVAPGLSRHSFMGVFDESDGGYELRYDMTEGRLETRRAGERWRVRDGDVFEHLRASVAAAPVHGDTPPFAFRGGFVGHLGYELKAICGSEAGWRADTPDAAFLYVDRFLAVDHAPDGDQWWAVAVAPDTAAGVGQARAWLDALPARLAADDAIAGDETRHAGPVSRDAPVTITMRHDRAAYVQRVEQCKALIVEGESYELCMTNRLSATGDVEPGELYHALRERNPAPYAAFVRFATHCLHSSSPERFLRMEATGAVEAKPIKGTIRRGATHEEDQRLKAELAASEKDFAENLMIVDLLRHDLGRCCEIGSVGVPALASIESYATVHQMVSTVRGQRRTDVHPLDLIRSAFPGGSMTGAPKLRTMRLLDELEGGPRGVYSGALGWIGLDGAADLAIVIRTIVQAGDDLSIGCGGAVTILSDAVAEYDEMLLKARAPLAAIAAALTGDPGHYVVEDGVADAPGRAPAARCGADQRLAVP